MAKANAVTAKRVVTDINVEFELNAKNGLRRVMFGLEKSTNNDEVDWTIEFKLFEREKKSDKYEDPLVSLKVKVDTKLFANAENASKGLTSAQTAHALGPAAQDAKLAAHNEIGKDEAEETIKATIKK